MATTEQQKKYHRRYREKVAKIRHYSKELDAGVVALEKMDRCAACASAGAALGLALACGHTPSRRNLVRELELARGLLAQLEH